jgi:hypothetical protein
MARRTRKILHDDETRARIRAAAIIKRLQDFVLGDNPSGMSRNQVAAAIALLKKVLPDLGSVDFQDEPTKTYVIRTPPVSNSMEEWLRDYGPKQQVLDLPVQSEP